MRSHAQERDSSTGSHWGPPAREQGAQGEMDAQEVVGGHPGGGETHGVVKGSRKAGRGLQALI